MSAAVITEHGTAPPTVKSTVYVESSGIRELLDTAVFPIVRARHARPWEALDQRMPGITTPPAPQTRRTSILNLSGWATAQIAQIDSLAFDVFAIPDSDLKAVVFALFHRQGLLEAWNISDEVFAKWVAAVEANYHPENPFHNFRHAVNVLQTLNVFLTQLQAAHGVDDETPLFTHIERLALFVAAASHDVQHPALTNAHLCKVRHPLAVRYNDRSVLENHHAAVATALLRQPEWNLLENARTQDNQSVRELLISLILATDVSKHRRHTADLNNAVKAVHVDGVPAVTALLLDPEGRTCLLHSLLEAADISNEIRDFSFSQRWAPLVKQEFYAQGDLERTILVAKGSGKSDEDIMFTAVEKMFDRTDGESAEAYDQPGFIQFVCMGLYKALETVSPDVFGPCVRNLNQNLAQWTSLQKK